MKRKNVTMGDIARALGISTNAVSIALSGKEGISESLRREVIRKADEMNYTRGEKPAGNIIALIPQRIAPGFGSGYFYEGLCFQLESYAREKGYLLMTCSVSDHEEDACIPHPILRQIPSVGVLTIGNFSREYCSMISTQGFRYLMLDQYYDGVLVDSITTANSSAGYLLTEHLIQMGHQKIQFFGDARKTSSLADRWNGYKRAMRDHQLPILYNSFIDANDREGHREYELVKKALEELEELPTAFVCGHDLTANLIIDLLKEKGLRCPEDFSIVGFDNVQFPNAAPSILTTYRTPKEKLAQAAVERITQDQPLQPHRTQLFGEIVYRDSVRDLRKA